MVENTGRFGPERLGELLRNFAGRSMRVNGVIYPYWENAARLVEHYAPLAYRFAKAKVPEKVEAAVEKHREERLEQKYKEQQAEEPVQEQGKEE